LLDTGALALIGLLLLLGGVLELWNVFHAGDEQAQRSSYLGGWLSILGGLLLLAEPVLILRSLLFVLAVVFLLDGCGKVLAAFFGRKTTNWFLTLAGGLISLLLGASLWYHWPLSGVTAVSVIVGVRLLAQGWSLALERSTPTPAVAVEPDPGAHPDVRLRLPPDPHIAAFNSDIAASEAARRSIDRYWFFTFLLTFFAIHVGRMSAELNLVGLISPGVAVAGDVVTALVLAYGLLLPLRLAWRKCTRPVERRAWRRMLVRLDSGQPLGLMQRMLRGWLLWRMNFDIRMAAARRSPRAALRWGLHTGLPLAACLIGLAPIWGFSWYFNTENWATEMWDRWAESRTDPWREKMIEAVYEEYRPTGIPAEELFHIHPEGVGDRGDFSFIVIGDPGEGDGSQLCLHDRLVLLGQKPEMKFLVISSDVIYPAGAMKDYEPNFYLPFKGFTKPIYAMPGNHDWYDALEGFNANFLEANAARVAMRARVEADLRLTTTTDQRIEALINEGARLRREYNLQTGKQRAPFFDIQTDQFALLVVDTGVARRVDPLQRKWLEGALERARGKFKLAVLGHPLYAGGRYQGEEDKPFAELHQLLRDHEVEIAMAGDTHYLEYYREHYEREGKPRNMEHFVNGGGGAYLSIGTPLDWPAQPATAESAFYPRLDAVFAKLDTQTPAWKMPIWMWVKHLKAWPLTAETMAGVFDYNGAPFFQSFYEVRVEPSKNVVRLLPHGASGRLRWRDLQIYGQVKPAEKSDHDEIEFVYPLRSQEKVAP
jgi:uncharacterized membrane protein HdeD (DUF308 family)